MSPLALTIYTLMWPALVAVIMFVIARGFFVEWRAARKHGKDLI